MYSIDYSLMEMELICVATSWHLRDRYAKDNIPYLERRIESPPKILAEKEATFFSDAKGGA